MTGPTQNIPPKAPETTQFDMIRLEVDWGYRLGWFQTLPQDAGALLEKYVKVKLIEIPKHA